MRDLLDDIEDMDSSRDLLGDLGDKVLSRDLLGDLGDLERSLLLSFADPFNLISFPESLRFFFGVIVEDTESVPLSANIACFQPVKFLVKSGRTPKLRAGGLTMSLTSTNAMCYFLLLLLVLLRSDLVDGDGDLEEEEDRLVLVFECLFLSGVVDRVDDRDETELRDEDVEDLRGDALDARLDDLLGEELEVRLEDELVVAGKDDLLGAR